MTTNMERSPLDNEPFDRLVDAELSEPERRELLVRLDREPGGWRRCALAFLEAQCWKQAFRVMQEARDDAMTHDVMAQTRHEYAPAVSRRPTWPHRLGTLIAMAASFLVAFWIGSLVQRERTVLPVSNFGDQVATVEQPASDRSTPWRTVAVSDSGSGRQGPISTVRAVERNNVDDRWLESLPSAIPDDVRQAFQRSGHEIKQHRQLVPVPLDDGRRLVVPVDQVDVHYIGNGSY